MRMNIIWEWLLLWYENESVVRNTKEGIIDVQLLHVKSGTAFSIVYRECGDRGEE